MDSLTPSEPKPRRGKKAEQAQAAPVKKELTAHDVLEMMNAAKLQKEQDRQDRYEQLKYEREQRKQRLYEHLNALFTATPNGQDIELGHTTLDDLILNNPLSQNILQDAHNQFEYRNGRAFISFEGAMVPMARKHAIRYAGLLSEAVAKSADSLWSTYTKNSLQHVLASQATAERIVLPDSVEEGLDNARHATDAMAHFNNIKRHLEEKRDWQPRRDEAGDLSSKPVTVAEIIAQEASDDEYDWGDGETVQDELDKEVIGLQQQAFDRAQGGAREQIALIEDEELRLTCEKQLSLFAEIVDPSHYIETQLDSAHDRWLIGEEEGVLNAETHAILANAFLDEMYGKIEEEASENN